MLELLTTSKFVIKISFVITEEFQRFNLVLVVTSIFQKNIEISFYHHDIEAFKNLP